MLFVSDYRLIDDQDIYNHYVTVTRTMTRLVMVYIHDDEDSKQVEKNLKTILGESKLKVKDTATVVYCAKG